MRYTPEFGPFAIWVLGKATESFSERRRKQRLRLLARLDPKLPRLLDERRQFLDAGHDAALLVKERQRNPSCQKPVYLTTGRGLSYLRSPPCKDPRSLSFCSSIAENVDATFRSLC